MQYYDISPTISPDIAVFPGDTPFSRDALLDLHKGDHLTLSSMTTTLHLGSHADAPCHYHKDGADIASVPLETYMGDCQVICLTPQSKSNLITVEDLVTKAITSEKILFSTGSFPDPNQWKDDFTALSPALMPYLADKGVTLVGIDTPSVDYAKSKTLETHNAIYRHKLAILEGLYLTEVPEGHYNLIALPLKIAGADGAPVRAILLPK